MKKTVADRTLDMSDLTTKLLTMPQVLRVGVENLSYDIRYNSQTKQIEVTYEFTCGIPHIKSTITVDYEFGPRDTAANVTRKALRFFSARLADAIERAMRQLAYQALFEAGVDLTDSVGDMASAMSANFRREVAQELGVRRGRPKGKRKVDSAAVLKFKKDVRAIVKQLNRVGSKVTRTAIATRLYERHSNPLREFKRKLNACELDFEELIGSG